MMWVLALAGLIAALCGCQARNPYAAIGPAKVPPPGMQTPAPYYPPGATPLPPGGGAVPISPATPQTGNAAPDRGWPSAASAKAASSVSASGSMIVAEPEDRQPIRIVENPAPAARTASAAAGASAPRAPSPQQPAATPTPPQPAHAPPGTAPAYNRTRGYMAPPAGAGSGIVRSDPNVKPAAYQSPATFIETPPASGLWRPR